MSIDMQRVVKSHGYIHIVRIGRCERYLTLGNDAGCFSPNAHNVYIDMLGCQVLVSKPIHIELLNRIKKGIRVATNVARYCRYNIIMMSNNNV